MDILSFVDGDSGEIKGNKGERWREDWCAPNVVGILQSEPLNSQDSRKGKSTIWFKAFLGYIHPRLRGFSPSTPASSHCPNGWMFLVPRAPSPYQNAFSYFPLDCIFLYVNNIQPKADLYCEQTAICCML